MIRPQCLVFGLLLLGVVQWTTVCSAEGFEEKTVSLDVNKMVMDALDLSTDPCSDFYQFACGGWLAAHANLSASADQDSKSFTTIAVHNNAILAAAVNDPKNSMLFEFNRACLDEDSINELGFGPASPDYQTASGVKDVSTFLSSAAELTLKGYTGILWGLGVAPNAMQPTVNVLQMTQGGVSLPYPALYTATDNETLALQQQYRTYISGLFQLVGVQTATSDDWAAQVFAFEQRVAEFTVPSTALFDPFVAYNNFTGPQLQALMPDVPLYAYFEVLLRSDEPSLAVLDAPSFFANMSSLLAAAPTASLMHYLQYKVLNSAAPLLSTPFQRLHFYFYSTVLEGVAEAPPRWETCLSLASAALPDLLGSAFVKAAFPPSAAQLASQMVSAIETAFTTDLQTVSWMDNQTRALALQKHAQLLTLVGGPANPANYSTVAIGKSFWDNVQACAGYQTSALVRAVGSQVDRSRWEMPAQTINAYYDPTLNDLVMIAGILQVPYFDPSGQFPLAMQFGGAGVIAGHESTHSMDSEGADYNGQGMLTDWWNPQTRANFEERVQCVIDQYSQYEVLPGVYVNGVLTQGENVADLGGVNNAFNALASVLGDELNDPSTVVPKFTNAQLFFVAYAQGWCTVQTPQLILELINTDPHSPPRYRVIGPLQDSEQFAQAFSCPVNSYMNPPNKCSVW